MMTGKFLGLGAASFVVALLLAGCSSDPEKGKQRYLQSGLRLMKQERYAEAAVQFRNALKLDPKFVGALYNLAQAQLAGQHWTEAYAALRQAIELDPKRLDARLSLGGLLLGARDYKGAEVQANRILAQDSKNSAGYGLRGLSLAMRGENAKARDAFLKVVELQPRNVSARISLALVNITLHEYGEAEKGLLKAIEVDPKFEQTYINLASLHRLMRQVPKAEAVMQDALRKNPESIVLHIALADLLIAQGKNGEAEDVLKMLTDRHPKSAEMAVAVGDFYLQRGDRASAAQSYQRGIQADSRKLEPKQRMVDWFIAGGQLQEAQDLNGGMLREEPKNVAVRIAQGRILLAQKKTDQAITELRTLVREASDSWQTHYFLAAAYRQKQMPGEAKAELEQALRLSAESILIRQGLAELCLETGELGLARETATRAVQLQPANVHSRILLGTVLLREKQLPGAREQFTTALRLTPDEPGARTSLGMVDAAEGKYADAEREFETALKANSRFIPALTALAEMLEQRNQAEKAIARVTAYVVANPGDASAHLLLGSLQAGVKRYASAKEELNRALGLDSNLWQADMRLAEVCQAQGETEAAIARYERVLVIQPKSAVVHGIVAGLYYGNRNAAAARKHYEQALALDPHLGLVANNLAWLHVNEGGDLDVALSLAQTAKRQLPESPAVSDTLAWILNKKGLHAAAIPVMQECVAKVPSSAVYRYHLGMALLASGKKREAKTQLEIARQLKLGGNDDQAARAALAGIN
jgi:tetratricopeptide (TPR) repeat protein